MALRAVDDDMPAGPPSRDEVLAAQHDAAVTQMRRERSRGAGRVTRRSAQSAAAEVIASDAVGTASKGLVRQNWQEQAWNYLDQVGELHYAASFYGNCLSRVTLQAGVRGRDGKVSAAFDDEGEPLHPLAEAAAEAISELRSPIGGQPQIMWAFGFNLAVAGECHLVGTQDRAGLEVWEVLSTDELRQGDKAGTYKRVERPNDSGTVLNAPYIVRIWQSHPRFSKMADSSVRAVLDILEELVLLTRQALAAPTSRIAGNTLLLLPDELDLPNDELAPDGSEPRKPFVTELLEYIVAPIKDRGSAASVAPMPVTGKAEFLAQVRTVQIPTVEDANAVEHRREAVERLAQGLDLPVEVVRGHMQTTFANAAAVDESTFKSHLEPKCELIVDGVTEGYLHPTLKSKLGESVALTDADGNTIVVWFDASELITHPNQDAAADAAYGTAKVPNFGIGGSTYRRVKGFAEGDRPDQAEIDERIRIAQLLNVRETVPGLVPESADQALPTDPAIGGMASPDGMTAAAVLAERVAAAAEVTVERAVERAGARLRSKANKDTVLRERLTGVANRDVPAVLGAQQLATFDELFAGEFDALQRSVALWAAAGGVDRPYEAAAAVIVVVADEARRRLTGASGPMVAAQFAQHVAR